MELISSLLNEFVPYNFISQIFHIFIKLYHLAKECRQLQKPGKANIPKNLQTSPPLDEFLLVAPMKVTLDCQFEDASPTSTQVQQESPVIIDDQALAEFTTGQERYEKFMQQDLTFLQPSVIHSTSTESQELPLPPNTTTNKASVTATPIQTIEPVLGFTSTEVQQI